MIMADKKDSKGTIEIAGQKFELEVHKDKLVTVTDRGGHDYKLLKFKGIHYMPLLLGAPKGTNYVEGIKTFKLREDDVYFVGYPRSGTHWTFEMMSMLLNGKAETIERFKEHLELTDPAEFDKLTSPRIINTHVHLSNGPTELMEKKVKVVYTLRDPKDIIVSMYRAYYGVPWPFGTYNRSFGDYLQLHLDGTVDLDGVFYHLHDTEEFMKAHPDVPVHIRVYEDAKQDPTASLQKLSDFLGLKRDDALCKAVAEKCEFSKMKKDKEKFALTMDGENFLYRKGQVGDWRNYFTEEMLEDYYRVYEEKMAGSRFYQRYSRDKD